MIKIEQIIKNKFPKFNTRLKKFVDYGTIPNCEKFTNNMFYYELREQYKTQDCLKLDNISDGGYFLDTNQLLPIDKIKTTAINGVHIFAHTKEFWVTLDCSGVYPVLHPKDLSSILGEIIPDTHKDIILFPKKDDIPKLTKPTNMEILELTGTITFKIKDFIYAIDKTTGKYLTDSKKLNWVDINALVLQIIKNNNSGCCPYDRSDERYSVDLKITNKILTDVI